MTGLKTYFVWDAGIRWFHWINLLCMIGLIAVGLIVYQLRRPVSRAVEAAVHTIEAAHRHGKAVSVCGEMAGDPAGALLLLGMGVDTLSMSPALLAEAKLAIRCVTRGRANRLAATALGMGDGFSIHRLVNGALEEIRGSPESAGVQLA